VSVQASGSTEKEGRENGRRWMANGKGKLAFGLWRIPPHSPLPPPLIPPRHHNPHRYQVLEPNYQLVVSD